MHGPHALLTHVIATLFSPARVRIFIIILTCFVFTPLFPAYPAWMGFHCEDVALHTTSFEDSECYLLNRERKEDVSMWVSLGSLRLGGGKVLGEKSSFPCFPRELACLDLVSPAPCPGLGGCGPPLGGLEGGLRDAKCTMVEDAGQTLTYTGYQGSFSLHIKEPSVARECQQRKES